MSKIQIIPGFEVEPGNCSLRVVTLDFLKSRGFDPNLGYGFKQEQSDRYGGKKLKLHAVKETKFKGGSGEGRKFAFIFSPEGTKDTYRWNEYMFKQYWDALDAVGKKAAKQDKDKTPEAPPMRATPYDEILKNKVIRLEDEVSTLNSKIRSLVGLVDEVIKENKILSAKISELDFNAEMRIAAVEETVDLHDKAIDELSDDVDGILEQVEEAASKPKKDSTSKLLKVMLLSSMAQKK
jgi:hypothetical protein